MAILEVDNLAKRFGKLAAVKGNLVRDSGRADSRPHRPERLGQDHDLPPHQRLPQAHLRRRPLAGRIHQGQATASDRQARAGAHLPAHQHLPRDDGARKRDDGPSYPRRAPSAPAPHPSGVAAIRDGGGEHRLDSRLHGALGRGGDDRPPAARRHAEGALHRHGARRAADPADARRAARRPQHDGEERRCAEDRGPARSRHHRAPGRARRAPPSSVCASSSP